MTLTEFYEKLYENWGRAIGDSLVNDFCVTKLDSLTAKQALEKDYDVKEVWVEFCKQLELPKSKW